MDKWVSPRSEEEYLIFQFDEDIWEDARACACAWDSFGSKSSSQKEKMTLPSECENLFRGGALFIQNTTLQFKQISSINA